MEQVKSSTVVLIRHLVDIDIYLQNPVNQSSVSDSHSNNCAKHLSNSDNDFNNCSLFIKLYYNLKLRIFDRLCTIFAGQGFLIHSYLLCVYLCGAELLKNIS